MPITRHRITLPGVKPIQTVGPGYEAESLRPSTARSNQKPGSGFLQSTSASIATVFRSLSTDLRRHFPTATGTDDSG
jgi:hypothetical protein